MFRVGDKRSPQNNVKVLEVIGNNFLNEFKFGKVFLRQPTNCDAMKEKIDTFD